MKDKYKLQVKQQWCLKWYDSDLYDYEDDTMTFEDTKGNHPFMWTFEITRIEGGRVYITYPDSLENKELMIGYPKKGYNVEHFYGYAGTWECWQYSGHRHYASTWECWQYSGYRHFKRSDAGRFRIQSKSDSTTVKSCDTLIECKWWFDNICNISWNWKVISPTGEELDGKHYQSW